MSILTFLEAIAAILGAAVAVALLISATVLVIILLAKRHWKRRDRDLPKM